MAIKSLKLASEETGNQSIVSVEGTGRWMSVQKPKKNFEGDGLEYSVEVSLTDKELVRLKKETGMDKRRQLRTDAETGETFLVIKRNATTKDGKDRTGPIVLDSNGQPFTGLIGNGSKVIVQFTVSPYDFNGIKGMRTELKAVRVLELIPYTPVLQGLDLEGLGVDDELNSKLS